jgi:deferrochelatase/peroxidase EfeB
MSDVLRVDPRRLTAAREAYDKALDELRPQLDHLRYAGLIQTPWFGDRVSNEVKDQYNRTVMESDVGTYQAMRRYEIELKAIRDQFAQMEQAYLATESANTNLPRRVE